MDINTLAIVISILAVGAGVIGVIVILVRQGGRHDADIANLRTEFNAKFDNLSADLRQEIRAVGDRIDNARREFREEMRAQREEFREEMRAQREEFREEMRAQREETRALGDRIENRINLDERVRTVEERTAAAD